MPRTSTTDFPTWIADHLGHHEAKIASCLYRAIANVEDEEIFACERKPPKNPRRQVTFIVSEVGWDDVLVLTEKSRDAAMVHITKEYMGDLDDEAWESYQHAIDKDEEKYGR
jgi:hypothetical protein